MYEGCTLCVLVCFVRVCGSVCGVSGSAEHVAVPSITVRFTGKDVLLYFQVCVFDPLSFYSLLLYICVHVCVCQRKERFEGLFFIRPPSSFFL